MAGEAKQDLCIYNIKSPQQEDEMLLVLDKMRSRWFSDGLVGSINCKQSICVILTWTDESRIIRCLKEGFGLGEMAVEVCLINSRAGDSDLTYR